MKQALKNIGRQYKDFFAESKRFSSLISGILLIIASLVIDHVAVNFAARNVSNSAADLLLSHIPVFDLDGTFIYGGIVMVGLIAAIGIAHPRRLTFLIKSIALFVIIRSIFVTLTHIAPAADMTPFDPNNLLRWFSSGADLFFSGHTGLPFLIALLFWDKKAIRILFLLLSYSFATIALMGHLHYSIDVFAAFFITYGIKDMAKFFFKGDWEELEPIS